MCRMNAKEVQRYMSMSTYDAHATQASGLTEVPSTGFPEQAGSSARPELASLGADVATGAPSSDAQAVAADAVVAAGHRV